MVPGMGVYKYKGVGVSFADFIAFILNIPMKMKQFGLSATKFFIFIGYLIARKGSKPPLDPPL